MKHCIYGVLFLSVLLWLVHCEIGFLQAASFCHNGRIICSLFIMKVACESVGLVSSLIVVHFHRSFWSIVLLSIFVLSAVMDVVLWIYSSKRADDDSPKAMVIFPCGFTIEATDVIDRR